MIERKRPKPKWVTIYQPGTDRKRILGRYDPDRYILELQRRGEVYHVDLLTLEVEAATDSRKDVYKSD